MRSVNPFAKNIVVLLFAASIISVSAFSAAYAEEEAPVYAFPDKWMLRVGSYFVDGANTQVSINTPSGAVGTTIDFKKDLGGEDSETIPRVDAYYRFNQRHRIDFTAFSIDRTGQRTLSADIKIGEDIYNINETLLSDIEYTLYKVGYNYSFYHSPKVELSISAGINVTSYDFKFETASGSKAETAGVTVPLPMFGLRMGYAITPKWYVHYVAESFFIDFEDKFRGAVLNYELNTEYKLFKHFAIGAGVARLGIAADVDDDDWRGAVSDSYRGYTLFGTFYF
ncbi:MAG: hypothetical protein PVG12_13275 [Gammaproteobacteria bacterium]|jgi:hypothetical protein